VVFPEGYTNPKFRDSKTLSAKQRALAFDEVKSCAVAWSVIAVGPRRIEILNILQATRLAMKLAVNRVGAVDLVLVDGNQRIDIAGEQETVIGGDALEVSISAASILAKVTRDRLMVILGDRWPQYGFAKHSGYPTPTHRQAIETFGPCRAHRRTFGGVREFVGVRSTAFMAG